MSYLLLEADYIDISPNCD